MTGFHVSTQGLSVKYPESDNSLLVLDTAGFETSIKLYEQDSGKEKLNYDVECERMT